MRELHYAGESIFVSVDICTAVFDYARALASAQQTDVVKIPIFSGGKRDYSNVLLGPNLSLFCTPGPETDVDLDDAEVVALINSKAASLGPSRAVVSTEPVEPSIYDYD